MKGAGRKWKTERLDELKEIEESADKANGYKLYAKDTKAPIFNEGFIEGAKWKAERMFSKEEVNEIISAVWISCEDNEGETFTEVRKRILEQFKKK